MPPGHTCLSIPEKIVFKKDEAVSGKKAAMERDDMILISVDDHIIEPPDMFKGHLPAKYADDEPKLEHQEDGTDVWKFRQYVMPNVALNAVAGRPKEEYGMEPQGLDE